jgi:hypothetical protein
LHSFLWIFLGLLIVIIPFNQLIEVMNLSILVQPIEDLPYVAALLDQLQVVTHFIYFHESVLHFLVEAGVDLREHPQYVDVVFEAESRQPLVVSETHQLFQLNIFVFEKLRGHSQRRKGIWVGRVLAEVFDGADWPVDLARRLLKEEVRVIIFIYLIF